MKKKIWRIFLCILIFIFWVEVIGSLVEEDSILETVLYPIIGFFIYCVYTLDSLADWKMVIEGICEGIFEVIKDTKQAIYKIVKKIKKEF